MTPRHSHPVIPASITTLINPSRRDNNLPSPGAGVTAAAAQESKAAAAAAARASCRLVTATATPQLPSHARLSETRFFSQTGTCYRVSSLWSDDRACPEAHNYRVSNASAPCTVWLAFQKHEFFSVDIFPSSGGHVRAHLLRNGGGGRRNAVKLHLHYFEKTK
ncbi:hypothetical protein E2C01_086231 [Portunus trituberculatus]|uniref:Uncharacterized protein n=1 Tax=Portunus trituberculatus TaxID=210409 RepID=A0A5B7J081_PORTR|nr:hypothetical protein [Portunus trituberculatus]